ncbi:MAG: dephospho-CoA kinase, partial [Actinobacteria bacterium]|nr:dephospho-CoA kinase [Actinomycetota bacterium]
PVKRDELVEAFGSGILDSAGQIDRKAVAAIVFRDPQATSRLNAITHPAILRELAEGIAALRLLQSPPEIVVVEIPLLAEAPAFAEVADTVLAIEAPEGDRVERAVMWGRDEGDIRRRMALQATDAERSSLADTVIVNDGSVEELFGKLDEYWELVTSRGA